MAHDSIGESQALTESDASYIDNTTHMMILMRMIFKSCRLFTAVGQLIISTAK